MHVVICIVRFMGECKKKKQKVRVGGYDMYTRNFFKLCFSYEPYEVRKATTNVRRSYNIFLIYHIFKKLKVLLTHITLLTPSIYTDY